MLGSSDQIQFEQRLEIVEYIMTKGQSCRGHAVEVSDQQKWLSLFIQKTCISICHKTERVHFTEREGHK